MDDFETRIADLDLSLFAAIESQSTDQDKQSLLACQGAVRDLASRYAYLEIGSHLGGSIQPHLLDPRCARVYSIDKRPLHQPDERGVDYAYPNNSTQRMLQRLRQVAPDEMGKVEAIDGDTQGISPQRFEHSVQLCFIDGEHTDRAVISDFRFCLEMLEGRGAIVLHDAAIVYNGIAECLRQLDNESIAFRAYHLPSVLFVVEIGDFPLHQSPPVMDRLLNNHEGYLFSLQYNDHYRRFANREPFRTVRRLVAKVRAANRSE